MKQDDVTRPPPTPRTLDRRVRWLAALCGLLTGMLAGGLAGGWLVSGPWTGRYRGTDELRGLPDAER